MEQHSHGESQQKWLRKQYKFQHQTLAQQPCMSLPAALFTILVSSKPVPARQCPVTYCFYKSCYGRSSSPSMFMTNQF